MNSNLKKLTFEVLFLHFCEVFISIIFCLMSSSLSQICGTAAKTLQAHREENVCETGGKLIISNDQTDQNSGKEEKFETRNERKHCNSLRRCQRRRNLNTWREDEDRGSGEVKYCWGYNEKRKSKILVSQTN